MNRAVIRSSLFNAAFYTWTTICCFAYAPGLLLPRRQFIGMVEFYLRGIGFLERTILNLNYEVRGAEYLPTKGSYIVAAKHMSPYETLKLHLLFKDPAVILKKELLKIPLWGAYLGKSDVIAIDRSTPETAYQSLEGGAWRMSAASRPIVIFPQGTRIWPHETTAQKPYKAGIHRMYEATKLPVIPMATNSGLFWPRSGWLKSPGTVVFEFLPPVPAGLEKREFLNTLEQIIEPASNALMDEALSKNRTSAPAKKSFVKAFLGIALCLLLFTGYSVLWQQTAKRAQFEYLKITSQLRTGSTVMPVISGYPGPVKIAIAQETVKTPDGDVKILNMRASTWPLPFLPSHIEFGPVMVTSHKWSEPLIIDRVRADLNIRRKFVHIIDGKIEKGLFTAAVTGTADLAQEPFPLLNLNVEMNNHSDLLMDLGKQKIVNRNTALFMAAGLAALADEKGTVRTVISQQGQTLYAGPVPILKVKSQNGF